MRLPDYRLRAFVAAASALLAAFALPLGAAGTASRSAAPPTVVVSSAAGVRAELEYTIDRTTVPYTGKDLSLAAERRGQPPLYDTDFKPLCSSCTVLPGQTLPNRKVLLVHNLDHVREPEIIVNLYWGGAHCCFYSYVYRWRSGARRYDRVEHFWGDAGFALRRDGTFLRRDYTFYGRFDCFACSGAPLQVWASRAGGFVDVTRAHLALVVSDIRRFARCLPDRAHSGDDRTGCLAAWAAEEALLGRASMIVPVLERSRANGNLGPDITKPVVAGRYFIARLMAFLRAKRYL